MLTSGLVSLVHTLDSLYVRLGYEDILILSGETLQLALLCEKMLGQIKMLFIAVPVYSPKALWALRSRAVSEEENPTFWPQKGTQVSW